MKWFYLLVAIFDIVLSFVSFYVGEMLTTASGYFSTTFNAIKYAQVGNFCYFVGLIQFVLGCLLLFSSLGER